MAVIKPWLIGLACWVLVGSVSAAVLPEDRADIMYNSYSGDGLTVQGPSVLVRTSVKDKVSISANYSVDYISSASIDVITRGSPYSEERVEAGVGLDYLADRALISLSASNSTEDDYQSNTVGIGVSQDFFGDMTTLSLGYSQSEDTIKHNYQESFEEFKDSRRFKLGLTQVLTKNWIASLNVETIIDDGFLSDPYRQYRYLESDGITHSWANENYPRTRNSDAVSIRSLYYLPYRAAVRLEARAFSDSWGIDARNFEARYIHPLREHITIEFRLRTYHQNEAHFFADLFDYGDGGDPLEYRARNKELSRYSVNSFGIGATYELDYHIPLVNNQRVGVHWDFIQFDYDNFRDATQGHNSESTAGYQAGQEPTFGFEANVIRVFFSVFY